MILSRFSKAQEKADVGFPFRLQGMKAMILAAGLGTRLKPFTNDHPKALAIVNGKTILQRNIEYLSSFGIKEVIINVHHFPGQIIDIVKKNHGFGSDITISDESDGVLETGGGIKKVAWFFEKNNNPFVVMNVDILTDLNLHAMMDQHIRMKPLATLAVSERTTSRFFLFDETGQLCGWKNKSTGDEKISRQSGILIEKAFSGLQILSPQVFSLINREGKFSMVDVYLDLAKNHTIQEFDHTGSKLMDVGKPENILASEKLFQ
ncbi:MAG: nucleotidyltransferase family protein [Ginsengibacter sp.]